MSNRNDYDYFDLDNFDESYDSRTYRRRRPQQRQGRQGGYNRRQSYNNNRRNNSGRNVRRKNKRRTRNRIIIVSCGILLIIFVYSLLSVMFKGCFGSTPDTDTIPTQTKEQIEASTVPATTQPITTIEDDLSPTYFMTPQIEDNKEDGQLYYGVYLWNKTGYEIFGCVDEKAVNYANTINNFANKLNRFNVFNMVVPNHTEMNLPQRIKTSLGGSSQAENIKAVYANLSNRVTPVNCYNYLAQHNQEYIYFKSDHHWTALGAYYAYSAFAKTNDMPVLSLDDCTETQIAGFTGSFANTITSGLDTDTVNYYNFPYSVTMEITDANGQSATYDSPYYQFAQAGSNTYGLFLVGDNPLSVLKSTSEEAVSGGKKIAIVKESYGNAMAPYFTYNYEEVHVIDFRHFSGKLTDYCKQNEIDDILFVNGVMSANTQMQLDNMETLFD